MTSPETEQVGLPFSLHDYGHWNAAGEVYDLIEAGRLPHDTFFRLAAAGQKVDHRDPRGSRRLDYNMMCDIVKNIDCPTRIRADARELLYGELPDAIVDVNSKINYPAYPQLNPLYYRMVDLAAAIKSRRAASGQTIPERPYDPRLHTVQDEWRRCLGLARPLWRLMVKRYHPEWLENPSDYFPSAYIGAFAVVYYRGEASMRRGIVANAVFSDPLVSSFYQEAVTTGVRGVGRYGREDLRLLLADEHPELLHDHELPMPG